MFIFVELQMQGSKHIEVNRGLLQCIINSHLHENGIVICDKEHQRELFSKLKHLNNIEFQPFKYTADIELNKWFVPFKIIRELYLIHRIYLKAKSKNAEFIIFASAFPFTAPIINIYSKLFKQRTIVCMHGDIGVLSLKKNKLTTNIVRFFIKIFFRTRNSNTILLFYGESIKNKLFKMFPSFYKEKTIAIDHPYSFNNEIETKCLQKPITIASIGTNIFTKNSQLIYEVAKINELNIRKQEVKFVQIGNISSQVLKFSNGLVENFVTNKKFLSTGNFEKGLKNADYFIFFITPNSLYDLCPSGTFFDAVKYCTPIIALHNPFFDYYFEKLGNIGYMCNSIHEMQQIIDNILEGNNLKEYQEQKTNLIKARNILSLDSITDSFTEQYNKIKNEI